MYLLHLRYIVGKITYKDLCKMLEDHRMKGERVSVDSIPMLIKIHFPEFSDNYNDVLEKRDAMSKYLSEKIPNNYNHDEFNREMRELDSSFEIFFEKISEIVRDM